MYICDTHCDTLCKILDENSGLSDSAYEISIRAVSEYEHYSQVFACFIDPKYKDTAYERCRALIDTYYEQTDRFGLCRCRTLEELYRARKAGKTAAFLSIEGGECIRSLDDLEEFYRLGVRFCALTWNFDNHIAGGAMDSGDQGLTEFGKSVVRKMNVLGMIIDVSHLNRKSFYDIAEESEKPIAATHSCSDAVNPHPRNLTDDQFALFRDSGGYVGINFYPVFLNGTEIASIDDVIRHIAHFMRLGGEDTIGLGSDFDGISAAPRDLRSAADMSALFDRLEREFGRKYAEKIAYSNFERLLSVSGI